MSIVAVGGLRSRCLNKLLIDREMFSCSVDAGFVLALPFHHGDLEPDCAGVSTRGAYARDTNTSARLSAKNAGVAYLRDTTVTCTVYAQLRVDVLLSTCLVF